MSYPFDNATIWSPVNGGFMRSWSLPSQGLTSFVSNETVAAIDARLPHAIRMYQTKVARVTGTAIQRMMQLWDSPIQLVTVDLNQIVMFEVKSLTVTDKYVEFSGEGYEYRLDKDPETGQSIMLPIGMTYQHHFKVTKTWLDKTYGNWSTKLPIAQAVGLTPHEAVLHMIAQDDKTIGVATPPSDMSQDY